MLNHKLETMQQSANNTNFRAMSNATINKGEMHPQRRNIKSDMFLKVKDMSPHEIVNHLQTLNSAELNNTNSARVDSESIGVSRQYSVESIEKVSHNATKYSWKKTVRTKLPDKMMFGDDGRTPSHVEAETY